MKRFVLIISFFVMCCLFTAQSLNAQSLQGRWMMNANGWRFFLDINQNGSQFDGTLSAINHSGKDTNVRGSIIGNVITFRRLQSNQEYRGFLYYGNPEKGNQMAGTYGSTQNCGEHRGGWYAERQ